jgi:DHA2 family methylenomycin A resistance protein-like MFS transporter
MSISEGGAGKLAKTMLLAGISIGGFMVYLDMTIIGVALPAIQADLGGGIVGLQWVANAYTIVFAALLLSMGAISDRLGARRVYVGGLLVFLAASAASAFVPSLGALIAVRAVLGAGAAAILPASMALYAHAFPDPAARARALGIWAAIVGAAMVAGPVVGGLLVDWLNWPSIFLLNVPLALIGIYATFRCVGETERKLSRSFDAAGQFSMLVFIAALSYALMEGEPSGWSSPEIVGAFGAAALGLALFLILERNREQPLLPLRLFRNATVSAGLTAGLAVNVGISGILFALPLLFQQASGFSARTSGLALLPMMVPLALNPIFTGRIVGKIGARIPMTIGFGLGALGIAMLALTDAGRQYAVALPGLLLIGFGISFTVPALMAAVISSAPKELAGTASGALNASRQLGSTLGVAAIGAMIGGSESLLGGVQWSMGVTAAVFAGGCLLSFAFIGRSAKQS